MNRKNHPVGRVFAVLGITLLCLLLCLLGIIWVLEKGPSPTAARCGGKASSVKLEHHEKA